MRSSGSPGSWPPSAAEFRCVSFTLHSHPKTSNLFPEFYCMFMVAHWTFLTSHAPARARIGIPSARAEASPATSRPARPHIDSPERIWTFRGATAGSALSSRSRTDRSLSEAVRESSLVGGHFCGVDMSSPQPREGRDRGIVARLTHVRVVRPLKAWPGGRTGRDGAIPGRARTIRHGRYRAAGQELRCLPDACARGCRRPSAFGQRRACAHRGSGRSQRRPSSGTLSRPARPESSPARQHQAPAEPISELGTHAADLVQHAGADQERPAAVTAATAKTPLQITRPRRSPGPAAVTAKTPKMGLEITAALRAPGGSRTVTDR
jgi:hypothetical protein